MIINTLIVVKMPRSSSTFPLDNGIFVNPDLSTHLPKEEYRSTKRENKTTAQLRDPGHDKLQLTTN